MWKATHINHQEQKKRKYTSWGGFWCFFFPHFIFPKHTRRPANQSQHSAVRTSKGFSEIFVSTQHPCITRSNKLWLRLRQKQPFNATHPLIPQPHLPLSWRHGQMASKMCGIWHFNYRSPAVRPGEASLKNKGEQLKKKGWAGFSFSVSSDGTGETGAGNRPDDRPIKVVLLAWVRLAPSPDLILLASPLCPMASSIWGKASPAAPLSQLRAPAGSYVPKFWHFASRTCWTPAHPAPRPRKWFWCRGSGLESECHIQW